MIWTVRQEKTQSLSPWLSSNRTPHWYRLRNIINRFPYPPNNLWSYNYVHFYSSTNPESASYSLSWKDSKARRFLVVWGTFCKTGENGLERSYLQRKKAEPEWCQPPVRGSRNTWRFAIALLCGSYYSTGVQQPPHRSPAWFGGDLMDKRGRMTDPVLWGRNQSTTQMNDAMTPFSNFLFQAYESL